jgi:hypothetical protein
MEISHRSTEPFVYQPYAGPRHVPGTQVEVEEESTEEVTPKNWVLPVLGAGYAPGKKILKELGFFCLRGFTGWMRRDEARTTGYGWYKGERWAQPNFQKIAAWGRVTGNKPDAPGHCMMALHLRTGLRCPPRVMMLSSGS